jgi:hypothetical protein
MQLPYQLIPAYFAGQFDGSASRSITVIRPFKMSHVAFAGHSTMLRFAMGDWLPLCSTATVEADTENGSTVTACLSLSLLEQSHLNVCRTSSCDPFPADIEIAKPPRTFTHSITPSKRTWYRCSGVIAAQEILSPLLWFCNNREQRVSGNAGNSGFHLATQVRCVWPPSTPVTVIMAD